MDFKHEIIGLKDQGDKNHVDENVSVHGSSKNHIGSFGLAVFVFLLHG